MTGHITAELVTEAEMRQALVAVTRMIADAELAAVLPSQIAMELPVVLRCINELHALRAGVANPGACTPPPSAADDKQGG